MTGDPRLDDLKRLERDFATAMEQLYAVGNGLARLRHDVEGATSPTAPPLPVTQPPVAVTSPPAAPVLPIPQMPPVPGLGQPMPPMTSTPMMPPAAPWEHPAAWPPREPTNALSRWWRNESVITRVLGVAGAIVTLAGLVMLLVLAVQQQWFGPVPRVVLGALLALSLIGLSLRLRHRERAAGRSGHAALALAATGYAAAYLVVVAVTATYGWLAPVAGLALALLVVGSGLVIARRWDSQFLAVLLLLGSGYARQPRGVAVGSGLQLLVILAGVVVPALALLGLVFLGVWLTAVVYAGKAERLEATRAAEARSSDAGAPPDPGT